MYCVRVKLLLDDLSRVHVPSQWFSILLLVVLIICIALAADVYMSPTGIAGQPLSFLHCVATAIIWDTLR